METCTRLSIGKLVDKHVLNLVEECKATFGSDAMPPIADMNKALGELDSLLYLTYTAQIQSNDELKRAKAIAEIEDQLNRNRQSLDANGNPRYAIHFNHMFSDKEYSEQILRSESVEERYVKAVFRAKKIGGKRFHNKQFGGGIIFQSYNNRTLAEKIVSLQNL